MRKELTPATTAALERRQAEADSARASGMLDVNAAWRAARDSSEFRPVLLALQDMSGHARRCMYCLDSHGTDVEHFRPKSVYPESMFRWANLLLGCTECGRFKGNRFPVDEHGVPQLIDPTSVDPWEHLDFDPATGILTARFDPARGAPSPIGVATVEILRLDQREVLSRGHSRTFRRLCGVVERATASGRVDAVGLMHELLAADDHGLVDWCFSVRGRREEPFRTLYERHHDAWEACAQHLSLA
ncbi:MAG: hypothetical protein IPJ77_06430 [Planctomycetes bacterium]|nr:hypothetical protein [Planctomycetota bacterium]